MTFASAPSASSSLHSEPHDRSQTTVGYPGSVPQSPPSGPSIGLFELEEHTIDESPSLKVAVIGAGISGISAGILLPFKVPGLRLNILEKNADVGGTWLENSYPGMRCDIPADVYQSAFEPNISWSEEYAQGSETGDYWQRVAREYGVYERLRVRTKVNAADWVPEAAQWRLALEDLEASSK